jgi:hypothetical protein
MRIVILRPAVIVACLALGLVAARATSEHEYAKGEYAIIRGGLAPNKQMSLASHGEGETGGRNFQVWLMAEPAHRRIALLPGIGGDSESILDTAPDAFRADWSKDSRHVAVLFRSSRMLFEFDFYDINSRRVHRLSGPNLFKEVAHREVTDDDDERRRIWGIDWGDGKRIVLREYRTFVVSDPAFLPSLGAYGRLAEKLDNGNLFVTFAAEADCVLEPGRGYRVVQLRPGNPDDPPHW